VNPTLANSVWLAGCLPALAQFQRATKRVAGTQEAIRRRILRANAGTEFGRVHDFASIRSTYDYQQCVPLCDYDDYAAMVQRIATGAQNVLASDPVCLFEPTSGSSSAEKWIPYNRSLQREFQAGIRAWIADLFRHDPSLMCGQAFWSVSPALSHERKTSAGIPIGFDEDAAYLGGWQKHFVNSVMAVPSAVRGIADMATCRYVTLLFLIRSRNLKLVSVWNPTFFSLLVAPLREYGEALAHDLGHGTITTNTAIPLILRSTLQPDPRRASELRSALRVRTAAEMHAQLWPALRLLSCWTDANSAIPAQHLASLFPQARIQGKGLIATEGFVSFPLHGYEGSALAICSHFLEFLPTDAAGRCDPERPQLAHQLEEGQTYTVVLTTGGGLYRYQLHDLIEAVGRFHECPLIRFLGRESYVSDWFGEKLNEAHVAGILRDAFNSLSLSPAFAMIACNPNQLQPGYVLYVESSATDETLHRAAARIELRLQENFHYRYARQLGQLAPLRIFRAAGAAESYLNAKNRDGQRTGAIKQLALDVRGDWSHIFRGEYQPEVVSDAAAVRQLSKSCTR
jgi:GH3 auxin-responsive promoter